MRCATPPPAEIERWFQFASTVGYTVPRLSGDVASLRDPARAIRATKPCSLVPRDVLGGPDDLISLRPGRWTQADHIIRYFDTRLHRNVIETVQVPCYRDREVTCSQPFSQREFGN